MKINIIRRVGNGSYLDCFDEMEGGFNIQPDCNITIFPSKESRIKQLMLIIFLKLNWVKKLFYSNNQEISFSMLMGASFLSLLPYVLKFRKNYLYLYDAWPRFHSQIEKSALALNIHLIFFSSRQVTIMFNSLNSAVKAVWIPEGIAANDYYFAPIEFKDIDVLEFGRKFDLYHDRITPSLLENNYVHLYEKNKGEIIFGSRADFLNGLSRTKISVCIPSNITHADRSEGISSMTLRYLQSMASKCLIVGIMPEEMRLLFDYVPIIEIDMEKPDLQLLSVLENYDQYIPLIERNYQALHKDHTWEVRVIKMIEIIKNESGY